MSIAQTTFHPNGAQFSNAFAEVADWVASGLVWPGFMTLDLSLKLIEPFAPSAREQWANVAAEVARRALLIFAIVLLLPFNLLTPLALALRSLAHMASGDFVFIHPPQDPALPAQLPQKLKICTFNVAGGPEFMVTSNGLRPTVDRAQEAEAVLRDRNDDLIFMQEAFQSSVFLRQAHNLQDLFPYAVCNVGSEAFGLSSGLGILSKYPLENITFWAHPERGGIETWANKGLLAATVRLTATKVAFVFTTHLNGGAPDSQGGGQHFRAVQIEQIKQKISQYTQQHQPQDPNNLVGTFLCGDFNTGPDEGDAQTAPNPEWKPEFFRKMFDEYYQGDGPAYTDGRALNETQKFGTGFCTDSLEDRVTAWDKTRMAEWRIGRECLDHLLVLQNPPPRISLRQGQQPKVVRDHMEGVSDHLAVRGEYTLIPD